LFWCSIDIRGEMGDFTCPQPLPGLTPGTPLYNLDLTVVVSFPITMFVFVLIFYVNRNSTVFLRNRPRFLLKLSALGTSVYWSSTVLYDYLGPSRYPCALYLFLIYMSAPAVGGPFMLKSLFYHAQVSAAVVRRNTDSEVKPVVSRATFVAHFRTATGMVKVKQSPKDGILGAQFGISNAFWAFWSIVTVSPYLIAYLVRLGVDPVLNQGCFGCKVGMTDSAILIAITLFNFFISIFTLSSKLRKRDALRLNRECILGISIPLFMQAIFFAINLADPGGDDENGQVNWTSLIIISCIFCMYVQTLHQVSIARAIKWKILTSDNVDRLDRFDDVMKDPDLKLALRNFLDAELSGEALMFLDAWGKFRASLAQDQAMGEAEGRLIFKKFIERYRAPHEINLPSIMRDKITQRINAGVMEVDIFDEAANDVKQHLLRDGFARFLRKMKTDPRKQDQHAIRAFPSGRSLRAFSSKKLPNQVEQSI